MTTQNRYYSNLGQGTFITNSGGLTASSSALTVQSNSNWPKQFPFTVRLEPGTANEEVALVTSGSGTSALPYQLTRGYDGTNQLVHAQGASVIPGFCQLDFSQPAQHINLTGSSSDAHGLPASAWLGGNRQLINTYPYTDWSGVTLNMSSIPQTFNHLQVVYAIRGNGTTTGHFGSNVPFIDALQMQVNGVTTATYTGLYNLVYPSNFTTSGTITPGSAFNCGAVWNQYYSTPGMGMGNIDIISYADTSSIKQVSFQGSCTDHGTAYAAIEGWGGPGGSSNAHAISSIQLSILGSSSSVISGNVWLYGLI
jgi:hypothetical protein